MKGFGSGLIWGTVVGAVGLIIASETSPLPSLVRPSAQPPAVVEAPPAAGQQGAAAPDTAQPEAQAAAGEIQADPAIGPQDTESTGSHTSAPAGQGAGAVSSEAGVAPAAPEGQLAPTENGDAGDVVAAGANADDPAPPGTDAVPDAPDPPSAGTVQRQPDADLAEGDAPAASEFARPKPETDPALPSADPAPVSTPAPVVSAPTEPVSPALADTGPATAPVPDAVAPDSPAAPRADAAAPVPPAAEGAPAAETRLPAPGAPAGPEAAPQDADLPPPPPLTPAEQALADAAPQPDPGPDPTDPVAEPEGGAVAEVPAVLVPVAPLPPAEPLPGGEALAVAPGLTEETVPGLGNTAAGVITDRLPRIGDPAPVPDSAADTADPANLPPIDRYARPFENPEGKPLFAILLIDRGDPATDRAALAALPFPVTFALDPAEPGAAERAAIYRKAGQEIVMLASGIPAGATAADLEVSFAAAAAALPEAVAVLDLPNGGFQDNRPLATLVVPIVKGQGRGLVTYDAGLNPADQVASRDEVRATTIFRRLDAEGEPKTAIRRYLDRAAFKAAQEGRVTVIGEARPDTVAALMEWAVEGRATAVALAPVTAVLQTR